MIKIILLLLISIAYFFANFYPLIMFTPLAREISIIILILMMTSYALEEKYSNKLTDIFHRIILIWSGTVFIAFFTAIIVDLTGYMRLFWIVPLITIYSLYKGTQIKVKRRNIGKEHNLRIAHLSDLHLRGPLAKKRLSNIIDKVKKESPDIIAISGDIVDFPGYINNKVMKEFNRIKVPIIASMGNHDFYFGENRLEKLVRGKIDILRNRSKRIKGINFIGLDDHERNKTLEKLPKLKKKGKNILLYHRPMMNDVDLTLSGHTHGGQIFPFSLLVRAGFPKIKGLHKRGKNYLNVSQGTGTWGPPMRFGTDNEINIIEI
ncbi:MAG: metallophosphoesterase [Nanobdellota archaeon]